MINHVTDELSRLIDTTAGKLKRLDKQHVRAKSDPAKWSIQEILGHLVDSAVNNHQRFVRAQQVDTLIFPGYDQDHWVRVQGYNLGSWPELIDFWRLCNRHLMQVITRIPEEKLTVECRIGSNEPVTLEYLVEDYLVHLKHHLAQIERMSGVQ